MGCIKSPEEREVTIVGTLREHHEELEDGKDLDSNGRIKNILQ